MRSPRKTTALVLVGAVGLSSVAYGIGSQVGDGSAAARDNGRTSDNGTAGDRFIRLGPPPGLGDLAQDLGVSESALEDALRDYHDQERDDGRMAFATALADALGVDRADVQAALDDLRPDPPGMPGRPHAAPLRQLAAALDVTRAELRRAFRELRAKADDQGQERRDDLVAFLAQRFNLSESKVEAALPEFAGRGPGGPHGPCGPGAGPPFP